jgi:DNA-directed RNA polymerase specialized sigma24 family protein
VLAFAAEPGPAQPHNLGWRGQAAAEPLQARLRLAAAVAGVAGAARGERDVLLTEIAKLPAQQRAVLVLWYYEGLSDADIAGLLSVAPVTVRGYASRALAALRIEFVSESDSHAGLPAGKGADLEN